MTDSLIHFYSTYLFIPNFILVLYILYLIVFKTSNRVLYTILLIGLTFLIKLPGFYYNCFCIDEPIWIECSRALTANFNPYINVDPTTSGIGALIPLYLFNQLIHLNYFTIRILQTIMDLGTLYFSYKVLMSRLGNNKRLLWISIMFLYGILNLSFMREFDIYETEHFCIFIFAVLLYILNKLLISSESQGPKTSGWSTSIHIAIAGLVLGFSLFVKLQNLPVMFLLFIFYMIFFLVKRMFRQASFFFIYCLIPPLICFIFFLYKGSLTDFYLRYLITNIEYSKKGNVGVNLQTKFGLSLHDIIEHSSFRITEVYSIIFLALFIIAMVNLRRIFNAFKTMATISLKDFCISISHYKFPILFVLIFAASSFEIVLPKNFYDKYYLLLYQPMVLLFVCFEKLEIKKWLLALILTIYLFFIGVKNYIYAAPDLNDIPKYYPYRDSQYKCHFKSIFENNAIYGKESRELDSTVAKTYCDPKYIIDWGRELHIFAYGKYLSACRDLGYYHLLVHEGSLKQYYINCFLSDIKKNVSNGRFVLIDYPRSENLPGLISFTAFVNGNNLNKYFRSIKLAKEYPSYSFYVVELN